MESGMGFRFHPTDDEMVNYYLKLKMLGHDDAVNVIPEVNLVKVEPWEIPGNALKMSHNPNDQVWYFFCAPNYKYSNSQRVDRKTKAGFWKVTGKDRKVSENGVKKTLVFYKGPFSKAVKTNWVMHQYTADFDFPAKKNLAICKLKNKMDFDDTETLEMEQGQSSNHTQNQVCYASNFGGELNQQLPSNSGYNLQEGDSEQIQAYMQNFQEYEEVNYNLNHAMQWPSYNNYYG